MPALKTVKDYQELANLPKEEGVEVLVLSSNFRYRLAGGEWRCVGQGPGGEGGDGKG